MTRRLFAGLAFTLLASPALAAPVLKSEVVVSSPIVTVGDMFDDAGTLAEEALFRAPLPGTSGVVSVSAVRQAAGLVGLIEFDAENVERVRVARAATLVDETALTALISADLSARGILGRAMAVEAYFDKAGYTVNAEAVPDPARLVNLRYLPGNGAFSARFLIAGYDEPVELTGRIELMIEAPHLRTTMAAGTILTEADIEMKMVPLKYAETTGFASPAELVGKALQRQSRAGIMLRPSDVAEPALISRNDLVTVYFRSGAMTLTVKGQALGVAARGETVQVLNLNSKAILHGVAIAPGAVEVLNAPLTVAGL